MGILSVLLVKTFEVVTVGFGVGFFVILLPMAIRDLWRNRKVPRKHPAKPRPKPATGPYHW